MKNRIIALLSCLPFAFLFSGCQSTTTLPADQTKLIAKVAVSYAVMKVADKHPEKAQRIIAIAHEVRQVAGSDGFNTVDLLMAFIRTKADLSKLSPADQMLAGILLDEIQAQLKARIGSGVLTPDKLLIVGEVAGWVEDASKLASVPVSA